MERHDVGFAKIAKIGTSRHEMVWTWRTHVGVDVDGPAPRRTLLALYSTVGLAYRR